MFRRFLRSPCGFALAVLCAGCQDAGSDPTALLAGEQAHPAVALAADLPSLPGLAATAGIESELAVEIDVWIASWALPHEEGRAQRVGSYAAAAALAAGIRTEGVAAALDRLEAVLLAADRLALDGLPAPVAVRLAEAGAAAGVAREALSRDDLSTAVRALLEGSDLLRGIGPEGVARTLIARAEGRFTGAGMADEESWARAERLIFGARQAVNDADYGLAIQRAYYACQLLGVKLE